MKKRLLSGLLALCLLAFCLPVTGQGAEASLEEGVEKPGVDVKIPIETVRARCAGGTDYLDKYGVTREMLLAELSAHEKDNYYLGTPQKSGDWQSPKGDPSYNGSIGMNCAGFVSYVLRKCGLDAAAAIRDIRKSPSAGRWNSSRPYNELAKASNYLSWIQYGKLVAHVYESQSAMLKDGKCEKGDLVLRFWTDKFTGNDYDNHMMIFWGDSPGENKVWQNAEGRNHIGPMVNTPASAYILIKFAPKVPEPEPFAGFTDVREEDWFAQPVLFVKENGYMRGETETAFRPQNTVTRAQLVQVLYNMEGKPALPEGAEPLPFTDMEGHWALEAVSWAYAEGVSEGIGDDAFDPEGTLTREQAAVLFSRFKAYKEGLPSLNLNWLNSFIDRASISSWAEEGIAWAVQEGVLSGRGGAVLDPQGRCIRAELAQLIQNYYEPRETELPVRGGVYGTVQEDSGKVLPGAVVTLTGESGARRTARTDSRGEYGIYGLDPGVYQASAAKDGYVEAGPVEIYIGQDGAALQQDFTLEDALLAKLAALRQKFPHGKYWNHKGVPASWEAVTSTPCSHWTGAGWCNSYTGKSGQVFVSNQPAIQCLGFASMISDQLFGKDAPVRTFQDFDKLRVGDHIRLTYAVHSMIVIEKGPDYVKVVEVNRDFSSCKIEWDRRIEKKDLEKFGSTVRYVTRYPD